MNSSCKIPRVYPAFAFSKVKTCLESFHLCRVSRTYCYYYFIIKANYDFWYLPFWISTFLFLLTVEEEYIWDVLETFRWRSNNIIFTVRERKKLLQQRNVEISRQVYCYRIFFLPFIAFRRLEDSLKPNFRNKIFRNQIRTYEKCVFKKNMYHCFFKKLSISATWYETLNYWLTVNWLSVAVIQCSVTCINDCLE